ncbi:MAG: hypothetical protein ACR2G2_15100 [Pseudonocardia sp.]
MAVIAAHTATLDDAVRAVTTALAALRAEPGSPTVLNAVRHADSVLVTFEPDLTTIVLRRLLASIEDCHREGQRTSVMLTVRQASAARALRLDPRWRATPTQRAS